MRPPFVGRAEALGALESALGRARSGAPSVAMLLGEAGVGKTALLEHFLERVIRPGDRVRRAAGDQAEMLVGYGVLDQLFPDPGRGPAADPPSTGARLLVELGAPSDGGATVVVVDDAQWADEASLQALQFALRRLGADRVLAVVVAREVTPSLDRLYRLARRHDGEVVPLEGLAPAELASLALAMGVGPLPGPAADRLHTHTGGNPLHASTLLEEVPPAAFLDTSVPLPAPRSYRLLVLSLLSGCAGPTRDLVTAAAVLGLRCPLREAAALAGLDDPLPALDGAVAAQLLVVEPAPGPPAVTFRHPLTHAAVYHDVAPARRVALHARAAGITADERARLRHRMLATVTADDALAEDLTRTADDERRAGQWAAAADHLLAAARCASSPATARHRRLGAIECLLAGQNVPRAVALLADVDVVDARAQVVAGEAAFFLGRHEEARRLLETAWEGSDAAAAPGLAGRIAARLTDVHAFGLRPDQAAEWARRAYALAPDMLTAPSVATAMVYSGNRAEGRRMILEEARAGRSAAERQVGEGAFRVWLGDLYAAREVGLAADAALRDGGSLLARWTALYMLESVEYRLGLWDDLLLRAEVIGSTAIDAGAPQMAAQHLAFAAIVRAERGDAAGASELLDRAGGFAAPGFAMQVGWLAAAQGRAALATGDPGAAIVAVEALLPRLSGCKPTLVVDWVAPYVEALVAAGRRRRHADAQRLTPAEERVAALLADGATNQEIARRLMVSEATVKTHVEHIFAKLDVHSRRDLIAGSRR